ncbi:MAG: endonuclease domain-containing protein [Clostridia bacterium]|nr:endonuclease domain-containing protein [Clostridia bacterium]
MNQTNNRKLTGNAQTLRKNMTKEERHLWYDFLKECPQTFHRQKVIGNYIADFYCAKAKLVIEIDGSQHYMEKGKKDDQNRDRYFHTLGLTVVRYSNLEVNQHFDSVCEDILRLLELPSP